MTRREAYISVDVETSGPIPGDYDLLSIGACEVGNPSAGFEIYLKPFAPKCDEEALAISGLSIKELRKTGVAAKEALSQFESWITEAAADRQPIFVGFNAPFDWSFINWYFHHFLGVNPFGFTAIDIKAYYMGLTRTTWQKTSSSRLKSEFKMPKHKKHNCLADAIAQAEIFAKMLDANPLKKE